MKLAIYEKCNYLCVSVETEISTLIVNVQKCNGLDYSCSKRSVVLLSKKNNTSFLLQLHVMHNGLECYPEGLNFVSTGIRNLIKNRDLVDVGLV